MPQPTRWITISSAISRRRIYSNSEANSCALPLSSSINSGNDAPNHLHGRRFFHIIPILLLLTITITIKLTRMSKESSTPPARISYFVQVSPSSLSLVPRLIRALWHPHNQYILHYDLKISDNQTYESLLNVHRVLLPLKASSSYESQSNIHVCAREAVTYRGITLTLNFLTGISTALNRTESFDFFINLSSADFPTASQTTIKRLLSLHRGRNFIEWKARTDWEPFMKKRIGTFYVDTAIGKMGSAGEYLFVDGSDVIDHPGVKNIGNPMMDRVEYTIAKSSGWVILSREFCEYATSDPFARKALVLMGYSDASDEHYFATLAWNERKWRESVVGDNFRSIFFIAPNGSFAMGEGNKRARQHPFWVDERDEDGNWLFWDELRSRPGFFTSKVRDIAGFREKVEREMIGIGNGVDPVALKNHQVRVEDRFHRTLERTKTDIIYY